MRSRLDTPRSAREPLQRPMSSSTNADVTGPTMAATSSAREPPPARERVVVEQPPPPQQQQQPQLGATTVVPSWEEPPSPPVLPPLRPVVPALVRTRRNSHEGEVEAANFFGQPLEEGGGALLRIDAASMRIVITPR